MNHFLDIAYYVTMAVIFALLIALAIPSRGTCLKQTHPPSIGACK